MDMVVGSNTTNRALSPSFSLASNICRVAVTLIRDSLICQGVVRLFQMFAQGFSSLLPFVG